jgi:hypothetical protein
MSECVVCHGAEQTPNKYKHLCWDCARAFSRYVLRSAVPDVLGWAAKRAYAAGHRKGHAAGVSYQRRKSQVFRKKAGCYRSAKFDKPLRRHPAKFDLPKKRRFR